MRKNVYQIVNIQIDSKYYH